MNIGDKMNAIYNLNDFDIKISFSVVPKKKPESIKEDLYKDIPKQVYIPKEYLHYLQTGFYDHGYRMIHYGLMNTGLSEDGFTPEQIEIIMDEIKNFEENGFRRYE